MKKTKFSIIVPIYNVEKYLSECLHSILNQNYSDYEIICIDDASVDNSARILHEYAEEDNRITILKNEKNMGLSCSRNRGLEIAKGEYVFFVDSDDYISPNTLSVLHKYLDKNKVDILKFNFEEKIESGDIKENRKTLMKDYDNNLSLRTGQKWFIDSVSNNILVVMVWNKVYRREFLLENNLYFYEKIVHEDELFCIQSCVKAMSVIEINDKLYVYRRRSGSISTTKNIARLESMVIIVNEVLALWKNSNLEAGMNEVLRKQMDTYVAIIRLLMMYFPEHNKMSIGKPEDQFLFDLLRTMNNNHMFKYVQINEDELEYIKTFDRIIIYGAGVVGAEMLQYARTHGLNICGVAVSSKENNENQMGGYDIKQIDELLEYREDALVIVSVLKRNQSEITRKLQELGFKNILLLKL